RRFLLAALDLGDVAQADPGLGRDLPQGQTLLETTLTEDIAQQPPEQRHLVLLACSVPLDNLCEANATGAGVVPRPISPLGASRTAPTGPHDTSDPGSGAGLRPSPSTAPRPRRGRPDPRTPYRPASPPGRPVRPRRSWRGRTSPPSPPDTRRPSPGRTPATPRRTAPRARAAPRGGTP